MAGSRAPTILVTRPQPGADATAEDLAALGFQAVVLPFTETAPFPLAKKPIADENFQAIAVTSAASIRHLPDSVVTKLSSLPVFAVGAATAQQAKDAGFQNVYSADGDAVMLAAFMQKKLQVQSRIAYLCGQTRSPMFEDEMMHAGFVVEAIEVYQTNKVSQLTYKLNDIFSDYSIDAALLYSGVSASLYSAYWDEREHRGPSQSPSIFCISQRARAQLSAELQPYAYVCAEPNHEAMIALIKSHKFPT